MVPDAPTLVAQPGCGLGADRLDNLRVKARGDFPDGGGTEMLFFGGIQRLAWDDRPVDAVTVEGLFGRTVEAVGRTARIHEEGKIPVYFAQVDSLCPVADSVEPREGAAAAVGPLGDVMVIGGRNAQGVLLSEILHMHDEDGRLKLLPIELPEPRIGHSVHAVDERSFVVVGGASAAGEAKGDAILIDLAGQNLFVGSPSSIRLPNEPSLGRAFHAGARSPAGQVLVAGGCSRVTDRLECSFEEDDDPHTDLSILDSSLWIESTDGILSVAEGPGLVKPRYGGTLMFARDGVAFLAGGQGIDGASMYEVERYRPEDARFRPYGDDLGQQLDAPVVGAALHEGGMVLLALADGRILWVTEQERDEIRPWSNWCSGSSECFNDFSHDASTRTRGLIVLPGERVLVDGLLLPVAGVGLDGDDARDLFVPGPGSPAPPTRRVGSEPHQLADGSVLMIGGWDVQTGALATPVALRMRPALDGPDEGIPELDRASPGSLIASDPDRVVIEGETLRLLAFEEQDLAFPQVRAHARGFRSTNFRFEATIQVTSGEVIPHLILQHGGLEAVSVSFEPTRVRAHVRDPQARVFSFSCASSGLVFDTSHVLRIDVSNDSIDVQEGGEVIARCPSSGVARPWSVGVGASGPGEMRVSGLRLSRQ